jgi:fibronectin-binding autotransporter adhesin
MTRNCSRASLLAVLTTLALLSFSAIPAFAQCGSLLSPSTSWTAGNADFNTSTNWGSGVPNSTTSGCIINGTTTTPAVANLAPNAVASVLNLQVGTSTNANDTLNIGNNSQFSVYGTQIINNGAINMNAAANDTYIILQNSVTLSGTGTLTMSATTGGNNYIEQGASALTLTNQSTIQGAGTIGNGGLILANSGIVDGNVSGSTNGLFLNSSGGITNTGTLEATAGGTLNMQTVTTNTGGNITASGTGSVVNFTSSVTGGTLNSSSGGILQTAANDTANLSGVTISTGSTYTTGNNTDLIISGTITNNGNLSIAAGANTALMELAANTTLKGGGTVTLSQGTGQALIEQASAGLTLENFNNTIQGAGTIGDGALTVLNDTAGKIIANTSGQTLTLNPSSTVTNLGLLEATNGGTLAISGTTVTNTGANITANGGTVTFASTIINGGTLNSSNSGLLETAANGTATLNGVTISTGSTYSTGNNTDLLVSGTITNNGNINVAATANTALIGLNANTTLTGGGTVTLSQGTGAAVIQQQVTGLTLENVNNTIQGAGNIGNGGALTVQNDAAGKIIANTNGQTLALGTSGGVTNLGLLEATNGGNLAIQSTTVANAGGNITANGGTVTFQSSIINGGTLNSSNGGALQTAVNGSSTLNGITLSTGSAYSSGNNTDLFVSGTITNKGNITLTSVANSAVLGLNADTTLTGGGTVTMNQTGAGGVTIQQQVAGLTLTNTNNVIQGGGTIGNGTLTFVNQAAGIVDANVSGQTLTMNSPVTNQGILEATAGGTLEISSTTVNNSGGNITGSGGGVVALNSSTIEGGTLNGAFQTLANGSGTLDGTTQGAITISTGGTYLVPNNSDLIVQGMITNKGTIELAATANSVILGLNNNTTLNGGGTVSMSATLNGNAFIQQQIAGLTLTNVNNLIEGAGIIGNSALTLVNQSAGTVDANISGQTLHLNGSGGTTNTGLLEATSGGTLQLDSTTVNNAGGNITGSGGGVVVLNSSTIQGGTLNGAFQTIANGSGTLDGSTNGAITLSSGATYTNGNNSTLIAQGTINNNGNINLAAVGNNSDLNLQNNLTLNGSGTLTMSTTGGGTAIIQEGVGGLTLTNNSTIQGAGNIGGGGALITVNTGTIAANAGGGQTLQINESGAFDNHLGLVSATNNSTFLINGGSINANTFNAGTLVGSYLVDGTNGVSIMKFDPLGSTGGEITTLGNGTTTTSLTLKGTNANTQFVDSSNLNALNLSAVSANATLNLQGGYEMTTTGALSNAGTVHIGGSGSQLAVGPGADYTQSAGLTQVDSGGQLVAKNVNINAGTLQGTGTVESVLGTVTIANGATLLPGGPGSPGTMTIIGPLAINTGGTLTEGINGPANSLVSGLTNVGGSTTLGSGSVLNIVQGNGLTTPLVGSAVTVISSAMAVSGTFGNTPVVEPGGVQWNAAYNVAGVGTGNNVVLVAGVQGGGDVIATSNASGNWAQTSPSTNWSCSPAVAFACVPNRTVIDTVPINFAATIATPNTITLTSMGGAQTVDKLTTNGTFNVNSGGSLTASTLTNYSGGTLTGGTWNMNGGTIQANNISPTTGITTIAAGTTVTLESGFSTSGFVASNGTTDALKSLTSNQGSLTIAETNYTTTGGTLTNTGSVNIGTASLTVSGADYDQSGSTATTTVTGSLNAKDYSQTGGLTTLIGGTITATDNVGISGGTLLGNGTVSAVTTTISGNGILQPGTSGTPGTINVTGNLAINSGGTLNETLNGSTSGLFGFTNVSGGINLTGGVLDILQSGTFDPGAGTAITIMTGTSAPVGTFASITNDTFDGGLKDWVVSESGDNVILTAQNITNAYTATFSGPSANWTTNNSGVTPWACSPSLSPCTPNNVSGNTFSAVINSSGQTMTLNILSNPTTITVSSVDIQHGTLDVAGSTLNVNGNFTNSDTFSTELGGKTVVGTLTNYSGGTLTGGTWIMNGGQLQANNIAPGTGITTIGAGTSVTLNTGGPNASFLASDGTTNALAALSSNQGTLNINGGSSLTTNGALSNSGTLSVGASSTLNVGTAGASTYTNTSAGTTTVTGALSANNINDSGTTNVEANGVLTANGTYTASGTLTIFGNGTLSATTFDQTGGTTVIDASGILDAGSVDISGGTMQVDGTLDPTAVEVTSILDGTGTVTGNVTNDGTVIMGDSTSAPGTLSETGNYTQKGDGTLDEAISNTANGELSVTGNVTLDGTLDINLLGNPVLNANVSGFVLMTFTGTENGTFASVIGADQGDWTVVYQAHDLILEFTGPSSTSPVPEPRMVVLEIALLLGFVFAYRFTRRKQKAL